MPKLQRTRAASSSLLLHNSSYFQVSGADAEFVQIAIKFVRERNHEIRQRRFLRCLNVTIASHLAGGAANEKRRDVQSRMGIALAHSAAVQDQRMIQKRSVSI